MLRDEIAVLQYARLYLPIEDEMFSTSLHQYEVIFSHSANSAGDNLEAELTRTIGV